jgi:hypothetical protein
MESSDVAKGHGPDAVPGLQRLASWRWGLHGYARLMDSPYWNPVDPPPPDQDVNELLPASGAESVFTVAFLLELPHSIRVAETRFLVSESAHPWAGWTSEAMGALAGMPRLPDGLRPTHSIAIEQARVPAREPLLAAKLAFPDWDGVLQPESTEADPEEWRSVVQVSIFRVTHDLPEEPELQLLEWLSRSFDDALEILNQYLVILAGMTDEWHISSLSRIDLPPSIPYTLRAHGSANDWAGSSGWLDIHTWFPKGLDPVRPMEETANAAAIINEYRSGRMPFFDWVELYQSAEHHLGSGRAAQSVIAASTGIEVLINALFRVIWATNELDPGELRGVLSCGFRNQLETHLPRLLDERVDLKDEASPAGIWYRDCYLLRNRVVHEGHKPTSAEALNSKLATGCFARWLGEALTDDPRTDGVKQFLRGRPMPT